VAGWPSWLANLAEVFTEKDYRLLMHGYDIPLGCEFRPEDALGGTLSLSPELQTRPAEGGNALYSGRSIPKGECNEDEDIHPG
jgi:hypothetical protein